MAANASPEETPCVCDVLEDEVLPASPRPGLVTSACASSRRGRSRCASVRSATPSGSPSWTATLYRSGANVSSHAAATRARSSRMARSTSSSGAPFSASMRAHESTLGTWSSNARCRNGGRNRAASRATSRIGIDQALAQDALGVGRQLAARRLAGDGGADPVEFVEQARDGVTLGVEVDGLAGLVTQEQEAQQLRRQQLRDGVCGRTRALGRAHLLAADVQELVGHVERRLALKHLARDRIAPVARATGRGEVLAAALHRDAERGPTSRPSRRSDELHPTRLGSTRPVWPQPVAHVTWSGLQSYATVEPFQSGERRADLAAVLADDTTGSQPLGWLTVETVR